MLDAVTGPLLRISPRKAAPLKEVRIYAMVQPSLYLLFISPVFFRDIHPPILGSLRFLCINNNYRNQCHQVNLC